MREKGSPRPQNKASTRMDSYVVLLMEAPSQQDSKGRVGWVPIGNGTAGASTLEREQKDRSFSRSCEKLGEFRTKAAGDA